MYSTLYCNCCILYITTIFYSLTQQSITDPNKMLYCPDQSTDNMSSYTVATVLAPTVGLIANRPSCCTTLFIIIIIIIIISSPDHYIHGYM